MSYPFPPKTAIVGLIAGILGESRNMYWRAGSPLASMELALEILRPGIPMSLRVNHEQTKENFSGITLGSRYGKVTIVKTVDTTKRGFTTQQKLQVLRDVVYRIYCRFPVGVDTGKELSRALEKHEYVYPPYLGNVNFFAEVDYVGNFPLIPVKNDKPGISSIVPASCMNPSDESFRMGSHDMCFNVPCAYKVEKELLRGEIDEEQIPGLNTWRIVDVSYDNFLFHDAGEPIEVEVKEGIEIFSINSNGQRPVFCFY